MSTSAATSGLPARSSTSWSRRHSTAATVVVPHELAPSSVTLIDALPIGSPHSIVVEESLGLADLAYRGVRLPEPGQQ